MKSWRESIDMPAHFLYKAGKLRFGAANEHKEKPARHLASGLFAFHAHCRT